MSSSSGARTVAFYEYLPNRNASLAGSPLCRMLSRVCPQKRGRTAAAPNRSSIARGPGSTPVKRKPWPPPKVHSRVRQAVGRQVRLLPPLDALGGASSLHSALVGPGGLTDSRPEN